MSTDYDAVCDTCRLRVHAGQHFAGGGRSFGYGEDDARGRQRLARFLFFHAQCAAKDGVRILIADPYSPPDYESLDLDMNEEEWRMKAEPEEA